ncbi:TPA: hypothetical protein PQA39_002436 [Staphylococcus aureus]|nr:hypothetical protein [Staphylococcus aureus]HDJ3523889.1 hypothetical protein [Staphylococcus aureus]
MGIAPEVVMWRDVGDIDGVVCGEILAHVYSVEPENLMYRNDNTLQELIIL